MRVANCLRGAACRASQGAASISSSSAALGLIGSLLGGGALVYGFSAQQHVAQAEAEAPPAAEHQVRSCWACDGKALLRRVNFRLLAKLNSIWNARGESCTLSASARTKGTNAQDRLAV